MKRKLFLFAALAFLGLAITSCGKTGSVGLHYDDSDLEIDEPWVDYSLPVTAVNFDEGEDSIELNYGEEPHVYSYSIEPEKAKKSSLIWESSDVNVATVDKGVVTATGPGTATITVSNAENSFTPKNLLVKVNVLLTDISFAQQTIDADNDHQYQLDISYTPSNTTQKEVTWSSSNENLATVDDNGLVTTCARGEGSGEVLITATSAYINKSISVRFNVADRNIYAESAVIDSYESRVEIGHEFTIVAHAARADEKQITDPTIKYYSTNPEVLFVEEDTGVAHALATSSEPVKVYAVTSNGIESEKVDVTVFEVKVARINIENITLSNRTSRENVQIEFTYDTDTQGYDKASIPQFTYAIDDTTIATVTSEGKLFAVADTGRATLTVTDQRSGQDAEVYVDVIYECDSVEVTGSSSIVVGQSTQLTVTTVPGGLPTSYFTFESSDESVATVSSSGVVVGQSEGTVRITATVLGQTDYIDIAVNLPDIPFALNTVYVVGSANYASGVSKPSTTGGSWDKANQAKAITEQVNGPSGTLQFEKRAIIKFNQGDVWKLRDAERYLEYDGYPTTGVSTYPLGEYKIHEGAFAGTTPDMFINSDNNVEVSRAGYYAIYYAQYTNNHPEGWYSIYVGRHELNVSDETPQIQVNTSVEIQAHDWAGTLDYEITSGNDLITVARNDYRFTITAGATAGTATIVFTDDFKSVTVTVTISNDAPLPKTFEENIPYVVGNSDYHTGTATGSGNYWDSDASKAFKAVVSSEPLEQGVIIQYEAEITFVQDNEFKVIIGGETVFWDVNYQDTEGAFATNPQQMSKPGNVVVNIEGTYKIYVKCLDNNRGWQVYIAANGGGEDPIDPPEPSNTYYLKGTFNEWAQDSNLQFTVDAQDANHYTLEDIALTANDEILVHDPSLGDDGWYKNASDGSHYTVAQNGNILVSDTGTYDIDFYVTSEYNNHVVLNLQDQGGGDDPQPQPTNAYFLKGTFNSWAEDDNLRFTVDAQDSNHYTLADVELTANDEIKVNNPSQGDNGWYSNVSDGSHYTVAQNGNVVVGDTGTYDIDFYVTSEYNNHIVLNLQDQGGGDDPQPQPTNAYFLKGTFNSWAEDNSLMFTVDDQNSNHYTLEDVELTVNDEIKVNNPSQGDNGWYSNASNGSHYTVAQNGNVAVSDTGTYDIDFYVESEYNNHIVLNLQEQGGGEDPVDPPEPSTLKTLYFTNNYGWDSLRAYVWNSSTQAKPADWPGLEMTYVYTNDMNQAVYSITVDTALYDYIIFNSGSVQTVDIALSSFGSNNACYISGGSGTAHTVAYWNYTA